MNWQIGKARCRSDEYEAEIVGRHGDHLIGVAWNKAAPNEWYTHRWEPDGTSLSSSSLDLLPPHLSLEEAARDAARYQHIRMKAGADNVMGRFTLPTINLPNGYGRGSIAQHLDTAIDTALEGK